MDTAEFLKTHDWDEVYGWVSKAGAQPPPSSGTSRAGKAERDAFLLANRRDEASGGWRAKEPGSSCRRAESNDSRWRETTYQVDTIVKQDEAPSAP
jgi:hypothetical protein